MLLWPCGGSWINTASNPELHVGSCYPAKVETIISGAMYSGVPSNVCVLPHPNIVEDNKITNANNFLEFFISWNCRVCKTIDLLKETVGPSQMFCNHRWLSAYSSPSPTLSKHFSNSGSGSKQSEQSPYRTTWHSLCYPKAPQAINDSVQKVQLSADHFMWHLFPLSNAHFRVSGLCMLFGVRADIQRPDKLHRHHAK